MRLTMASKRTETKGDPKEDAAEKPKRRQIDIDDLLYRRCGMVAAGLGMSIPEYIHQRMTVIVLGELPAVTDSIGLGPLSRK